MAEERSASVREVWLWGAVVMLFALLVRLVFLNAPLESDDSIYFDLASRLSPEIFQDAEGQWPFRTGVVVPLAFVQWIFGEGLLAYYIYTVTFAVAAVVVVYLLVREIAGLRQAVITALLFSASAPVLYQSTNILPDTPNLVFALLSFWLFWRADRYDGRRQQMWLLGAAALGFVSYLVRMPNTIFLAAIPMYELLVHRSLRRTLWFSAFFAGFVVLESIAFWIMTGNPLMRLLLVPKGVSLWVRHQEELSVSGYLFDPFLNLLQFKSGWMLFAAVVPGVYLLVRERCYALLSLCGGALLLFLAYSYAVTSFEPLVRALPLQPRYFVAVSCVLVLVAGSLVARIDDLRLLDARWRPAILPAVVSAMMLVQLSELPSTLPHTLLFNDDAYFAEDRLVAEYVAANPIDAPVHAYPATNFRMYDGFSRLDLRAYSLMEPPEPGYYLLSKPRVAKTVLAGHIEGDEAVVERGELLLRESPRRTVLVETQQVLFVYIPSFEVTLEPVADLATHEELWQRWKGIELGASTGDGLRFVVGALQSPAYVSAFPGRALEPPSSHALFDQLGPSRMYQIDIEYTLSGDFDSLGFFWREYDDVRSTRVVRYNMNAAAGTHSFSTRVSTSGGYKSFRVFVRVETSAAGRELAIEHATISRVR